MELVLQERSSSSSNVTESVIVGVKSVQGRR